MQLRRIMTAMRRVERTLRYDQRPVKRVWIRSVSVMMAVNLAARVVA